MCICIMPLKYSKISVFIQIIVTYTALFGLAVYAAIWTPRQRCDKNKWKNSKHTSLLSAFPYLFHVYTHSTFKNTHRTATADDMNTIIIIQLIKSVPLTCNINYFSKIWWYVSALIHPISKFFLSLFYCNLDITQDCRCHYIRPHKP